MITFSVDLDSPHDLSLAKSMETGEVVEIRLEIPRPMGLPPKVLELTVFVVVHREIDDGMARYHLRPASN